MLRPFLAFLLYAGIAALALWPAVAKGVDSVYKADEERLLIGTWHQYGTEYLTKKGYWSVAANYAVMNTWRDADAMRAVLED